ncbi:MipA/OmpV family protein [Alteromonas sp. LMIT006]|uniref:MipA/OmpV family protein n=1 Tax=Alteromonadaceae TaxID=72275 RepID=UPI0020CA711E|nr:MipA/OmpV family protein [Alteromonas sp. LMIT006]UTP73147.1 MipA/OmpV family protein [Alteromonas sp. LMIT006]
MKVFVYLLCLLFSAFTLSDEKNVARDLTGFENPDEALPLWEWGLAGGAGVSPDYPASAETDLVVLMIPYVIYRGDTFRFGDGQAQAVVKETNRWQFDVSLGLAFPSDSDDQSIREGMPDLDLFFEVGPQATYLVVDKQYKGGGVGRLKAILQARAVSSTDFSKLKHHGYVFEPELVWQQRGRWFSHSALTVRLGATFATQGVHSVFYDVEPQFVTEQRPLYESDSGYLGSKFTVGLSLELTDNLRGFVGGIINFNQGAANRDSPLFEKDISYSFGAGFAWRLYKSDRKASY